MFFDLTNDESRRQPYYFEERERDTEPEPRSYSLQYDPDEDEDEKQAEYWQAFNDLSDEDNQ